MLIEWLIWRLISIHLFVKYHIFEAYPEMRMENRGFQERMIVGEKTVENFG